MKKFILDPSTMSSWVSMVGGSRSKRLSFILVQWAQFFLSRRVSSEILLGKYSIFSQWERTTLYWIRVFNFHFRKASIATLAIWLSTLLISLLWAIGGDCIGVICHKWSQAQWRWPRFSVGRRSESYDFAGSESTGSFTRIFFRKFNWKQGQK